MLRGKIKQIRFFRTLRFQLASTFLLLLTAVLAIVGLATTKNLKTILDDQSSDEVREHLGELKGGWTYFDEKSGLPYWNVDHNDPEEEAEAIRLQAVYVIADDEGHVHLASDDPTLKPLFDRKAILAELEQLKQGRGPIMKRVAGTDGTQYQVLSSTMTDAKHRSRRWYVAAGRSLTEDDRTLKRFRTNLLILFPIALLVCALVSWYSAGGVLRGLQSVQNAAQEITGSNLGLQIAKRGADDELDSLIESFNEMSRRLKASFDQMRQFSTDVSHELRTPLTAIQGQLEVALFTATRKEQLQEAIENALQDVERLSNLIRALLLLSQSESGQIPMHKTTVDLGKVVEDLVEQFQIPAEVHGVKLTQSCSGRVLCEADRTQMERVVTNLLSNAIKYTATGGWVKACVESLQSYVRLTVEDSGVGIPPDHLPHIFDRFYRVPDPNPEKGLGLGLSFVATIVKAHGGEIRVHSRVGHGSRFEVSLPVGSVREVTEAVVAPI
ncbi:MAG: HAMP domain-containing protein [Acidobacteriaceae bacterium]|nr:HAMP domain-containing protein [Acidobacteriaceae bacterium]